MHITRIELENIKSHVRFSQNFERGTTAISGENGAGKTTIIEAVAWAMFDLLDYKKDEFLRRGAKRGVVRVAFESGLDQREYIIHRDTVAGYYIYDPRLKMRIADKREEVERFLWAHLGVEPGTDLEALFRRAIGVPQGTFTAIFLETPNERKKAFEKLLKVEEYRQGADRLRETVQFVKATVQAADVAIAHAEGELKQLPVVEDEFRSVSEQAAVLEATLAELQGQAEAIGERVAELDAVERRVGGLRADLERLSGERLRAELLRTQKKEALERANAAAETLRAVADDYRAFVKAEGMIRELERERIEREKILRTIASIEAAQANVRAEQTRLRADLDRAAAAHREIEVLRPQVAEQQRLESELEDLRKRSGEARSLAAEIAAYGAQIERLRADYSNNHQRLRDTEAAVSGAEIAADLDRRESEIAQRIAFLKARVESDRKFQTEVRNGLCPILSERCLNLKEGQTLEAFLSSQFEEFSGEISTLENERAEIRSRILKAREAEALIPVLENFRTREEELAAEGKGLRSRVGELETKLAGLSVSEADLAATESRLREIGSPRERLRMLQSEAARETEIRTQLTEIDRNLERLANDHGIETEKLEAYRDLDTNWQTFSAERARTDAAYRRYLANEREAESVAACETEYSAAVEEFDRVAAAVVEAERVFGRESGGYDAERHRNERTALIDAERRRVESAAHLENARSHALRLESDMTRLARIREEAKSEYERKERYQKIGEMTEFIRETLRKSAPLVARNYVYHVSIEANQMFREITGNAERTLRWTEDYGIELEEAGYSRPFISLSGGEQMAAAMAVRLALLKQLSDIRLAFFDEPTTNMDSVRRENLALQISQITENQTFDQLFVISHDDTFQDYVDHVVDLGSDSQNEEDAALPLAEELERAA